MLRLSKACPECGKLMIRRWTGTELLTYPPGYPWYWWCGCGHEEEGGVERAKTEEEIARKEWEALNREMKADVGQKTG